MTTNAERAMGAQQRGSAVSESVDRVLEDKAARYVCGTRLKKFKDGSRPREEPDYSEWSHTFCNHPLVLRAEREGWARELRQFLRSVVRRLLMLGWEPEHIPEPSLLMPPEDWIRSAQKEAARAKAAEQWREAMIEEHGSMDAYWAKRGRG